MNTEYAAYELVGGREGLIEIEYWEAEAEWARFEQEAENAWLVAAESPSNDDIAFEQWEMGRGCYQDPQSGYRI